MAKYGVSKTGRAIFQSTTHLRFPAFRGPSGKVGGQYYVTVNAYRGFSFRPEKSRAIAGTRLAEWNLYVSSEAHLTRRQPNVGVAIILIILVIALLGGFSGVVGGPFYGTGYYGGGGLGLIIIVLLVLLLMGRL
jgi:hypothetical protein